MDRDDGTRGVGAVEEQFIDERCRNYAEAMAHGRAPELENLYRYWRAKRGDEIAPALADIRPYEVTPQLPRTLLLEVVDAAPRLRYRLVGKQFVNIYGAPVAGQMAGQFVDEIDFDQVKHHVLANCRKVAAERLPSWTRWQFPRNGRWLIYERLALPLSADGCSVDVVMTGVVARGVSPVPVVAA